jgi:hypothetical protein
LETTDDTNGGVNAQQGRRQARTAGMAAHPRYKRETVVPFFVLFFFLLSFFIFYLRRCEHLLAGRKCIAFI